MDYYIGIDLGTTLLKVVVVNALGDLAGTGTGRYPLCVPQTGYAEQDPEQWYTAMCIAVRQALAEAKIDGKTIRGVGFSGQMHGLVALDRNGSVLRPAIIHCDGRSGELKQRFMKQIGPKKMGQWVQNALHSGFLGLSLVWIRENQPETYEQIRMALLPKDYLRYRLTGNFGTEKTDAGSTLLFDNAQLCWSKEMCGNLGIDRSLLPCADHSPTGIAGRVCATASADTSLPEGIPVVYGGGDAVMQSLGNGMVLPGSTCVNLGTSGQVMVLQNSPAYDPLLRTHTFCHASEDTWYIMGAVLNACLAFNWFSEHVCGQKDYVSAHEGAGSVPAGSRGLLFLPYLTGERTPHMNEHAKGAFLGMTLAHGKDEMTRAVLEGVAFSLKDCMEIIRKLSIPVDHSIISGGGARSPVWRQIIADILEMPVYLRTTKEAAATGAALCAMTGTGTYYSLSEACEDLLNGEESITEPNAKNFTVYRDRFELYREAYQKNRELLEKLEEST